MRAGKVPRSHREIGRVAETITANENAFRNQNNSNQRTFARLLRVHGENLIERIETRFPSTGDSEAKPQNKN